MGIKVKFEDNTDEMKHKKDEAVERALEMIGMQCENYAILACPVDTGRLKNSLTHKVHAKEESVVIGTDVEYAPYVEMGTSRMSAQPYLRPAVSNHMDEYASMAETVIGNALK